ncbi:alpha/beta hydrolase [Chloroflexus sp.]|uniref:alpha/beta hydrolase n=1 Tax=Chloroflexus sp. TaxID=1904827 RepID=UPI00262DA3ED|nr:alpha/beta hydrolase [uncultured Chloroflexus sp.]
MIAPTTTQQQWLPDLALAGFETRPLDVAGGHAVLVRQCDPPRQGMAVLYVHGYSDYFFQSHLADVFRAHGYAFYAIDLPGHGRALQPNQIPCFYRAIADFYPFIDAAIDVIDAEHHRPWIVLHGHSAGGLVTALYAAEGGRRDRIGALALNSPFFDFMIDRVTRASIPLVMLLGRLQPTRIVGKLSPVYGETIYRGTGGEWEFDQRWKPVAGIPMRAGTARAILLAQRRLRRGLGIRCPILIAHSARSAWPTPGSPAIRQADIVLDVAHMRRDGPLLGDDVTMIAIEGGFHDLALSPQPARERYFAEMMGWLSDVVTARATS